MKGALDWILAHPELREQNNRYIAVAANPFRVVATHSTLDMLLATLGDDISGFYIHEFA